jgi:peptidoglycan/xylan/chitin deacetylase (PgdA/CDA1 family)
MLTIVPTIDTEGMHGSRPFEQFILGQVDGSSEEWGAYRIADICAANGAPATFFVDVYEYTFWGIDRMHDLCRGLVDRGFDVQLHTHPGWRDDPHDFPALRQLKREKSYLSHEQDFMAKLPLDKQVEVLEHGLSLIEDWTGVRPVAHRSGGYSINADTVTAMQRVGIELDSSMHWGHAHSQLTWSRNAVIERDGVLELPVTLMDYCFRLPGAGTIYRKSMKTDVDSCTLEELVAYVDAAAASGVTLMNLFMHSYSLLDFDQDYRRIGPDPADAAKLDRFLTLMAHRDDVRVMSCSDVLRRYRAAPGEFQGPDVVPEITANARIASFALAKICNRVHEGLRRRFPVPDATNTSQSAAA